MLPDLGGLFPDSSYSRFMAKEGTGRCINCGFLGKMGMDFDHPERFWDIERATLFNRQQGNLFKLDYNKYNAWPTCYISAYPIDEEVAASDHSGDQTWGNSKQCDAAAKVIRKNRRCKSWTPWLQHLSPGWHLEHDRLRKMDRQNRNIQKVILFIAALSLIVSVASVPTGLRNSPQTNVAVEQPTPAADPSPSGRDSISRSELDNGPTRTQIVPG